MPTENITKCAVYRWRFSGFWLAGLVFISSAADPQTLTVQSNIELRETAYLEIDLGGTAAGQTHDQLRVEGDLTLAGELRIQLADNYRPQPSDEFRVVTAHTLTGRFSNDVNGRVSLADGSRSMRVIYDTNGVTLNDFVDPDALFENGFEQAQTTQ